MKKGNKKILLYGALGLALFKIYSMSAEKLIKYFEAGTGIKNFLKAYKDIAGVWTIGYGSIWNYDKGRRVQPGDIIDEQKALDWMRRETKVITEEIKKLVKVPINQNQLDALTSFVYNLGIGALKNSTLLKLLNARADKAKVANEFLKWNKAKVNNILVAVDGLTKRRVAEKDLFLK